MRLLLLSIVACAGCGLGDLLTGASACTQQIETHMDANPTTPQLHLSIESCRADVDACPGLCTTVMQINDIAASFQGCTVTFDGSTANLDITYVVMNANGDCPVFDEPGEGP